MTDIRVDASRAVLVGASKYERDSENLPELPGVIANVVDFERILRDGGLLGLPPAHITRLIDSARPHEILEKVADACRSAQDTVLLYFSGHGLIGKNGDLLLATPQSIADLPDAASVSWEQIKGYLLTSSAIKRIVILDCCFSGRAADLMASDDATLKEELDVAGTIVITSSPRNRPSMAPSSLRRTAFTDAFLDVLDNGLDNGRETLTLDEVFTEARQRLKRDGYPEPQRIASASANDLVLVRNNAAAKSDALALGPLVSRLEARIDAVLSNHLSNADVSPATLAFLGGSSSDERLSGNLRVVAPFAAIASVLFFVLEIALTWSLGTPSSDNPYADSPVWEYPDFAPFLATTLTLLAISALVTGLTYSALRHYDAAPFMRIFLNDRRALQWVMRFSALNFVVVAVVSLASLVLTRTFGLW